jgi:hypothetical protein
MNKLDMEKLAKEIVEVINTTKNDYDATELVAAKLKKHFEKTKPHGSIKMLNKTKQFTK